MTSSPYGSWPSPISPADLAAGRVRLSDPRLDGDRLYWTEGRPDQGGRVSIWRTDLSGGSPTEVTPDHYVRSTVHEYGGGAWDVDDGAVVWSDFGDGRLWLADDEGVRPVTPPLPGLRFGDLRLHRGAGLVLAVREDHRDGDDAEAVRNTIVALSLSGDNAAGGRVLCAGADFYACPELHPTGAFAWVEWDRPNMPWDTTRLCAGQLVDGEVRDVAVVPTADEAAVFPAWSADELPELVFLSDRDGYWNLQRFAGDRIEAITADRGDLAEPMWSLGARPYALLADGAFLVKVRRDGWARLALASDSGEVAEFGEMYAAVGDIVASGAYRATLVSVADGADRVIAWTDGDEPRVIRAASEVPPPFVSLPESIVTEGKHGPVQSWWHAPYHPEVRADPAELPPVIVLAHGGPTGYSDAAYDLGTQFWTSRGIGVLVVNYGGSAGLGRAYRNRLRGSWGIVDVDDCVAAVLNLVDRGLADPGRLAIQGGSAGGFTTLAALCQTDVFAAGVSLYGVADLGAMARDTHKFESRYLDGLVGTWPEEEAVYAERSPINHVDDLDCPLLLLQGSDDAVVPPAQSELLAAAVAAKGLPVSLIVYDGEAHGFRRSDTITHAQGAELAFYARVFGFTPADADLPKLPGLDA